MKKKFAIVLMFVMIAAAACVPSQQQIDQIVQAAQQTALAQVTVVPAATQDVNQIVQATFQALTAQAASPTPTTGVVAGQGGISGKLSYPSEGIPPLFVVAFNVDNGYYYWVATVQNQPTYQIDGLPVGVYHVVAYTQPDGKLKGAYDQFYLCGLHQGCNDTSLIDVQVQANVVTPNIDPGDWYGGDGLPTLPEISAPLNAVITGSIAGQLSYPSEGIPPLYVVAFDANSSAYYWVATVQNQNTYQIDNLPPAIYLVVAYPAANPGSFAGGYSQAVPCGMAVQCTDHSLIPVIVTNGQVSQGVNPQDWYANPGDFPAYPLP